MRPGSAASLPVSTASTGLLCLSVGARVHRVRSDTEVTATRTPDSVRDIYILYKLHVRVKSQIKCIVIYNENYIRLYLIDKLDFRSAAGSLSQQYIWM